MEWLNVFGLIFIVVMLIPNLVYAIVEKGRRDEKKPHPIAAIAERIGQIGSLVFMIFQIPGTWFGWWSDEAFAVYLIFDFALVVLYSAVWIFCFRKNTLFRALALSIIPSVLFLFSGIMSRSIPLIISTVFFAPSHIFISCQNAGRDCQDA